MTRMKYAKKTSKYPTVAGITIAQIELESNAMWTYASQNEQKNSQSIVLNANKNRKICFSYQYLFVPYK